MEIRQLAGRAGRDRVPGYVVGETESEVQILSAALRGDDEEVQRLIMSEPEEEEDEEDYA